MATNTVLLVGGGIGGLTAALCLANKGFHVELFEQADVFAEVGAGIQLSPNCARVLQHLGLEAALQKNAFLPEGVQLRQWSTGEVLSESPLGETLLQHFGMPYYHMHRADLMAVLAEAAEQHPDIHLHLNSRIGAFQQDESGVALQSAGKDYHGLALIGADGIHSVVRAALWGDDAPRFTGCVAWRALIDVERLPVGLVRPMSTAWLGPGGHFVHYYVRGGQLVNCVCVFEKDGWEIESWTERGDKHELQADFRD
ncbi:MAG: FAD-dependent monooxygenase [Pseudomonadota bacterium]